MTRSRSPKTASRNRGSDFRRISQDGILDDKRLVRQPKPRRVFRCVASGPTCSDSPTSAISNSARHTQMEQRGNKVRVDAQGQLELLNGGLHVLHLLQIRLQHMRGPRSACECCPCPRGVHCTAGTGSLHTKAAKTVKSWRVLPTTDVGDVAQGHRGLRIHKGVWRVLF